MKAAHVAEHKVVVMGGKQIEGGKRRQARLLF